MRRALQMPALLVAVLAGAPAHAHPPSITTQAGEKVLAEEITAFRKVVAKAIAARDAKMLARVYARGFAHTHADARTDDRERYIAWLIAGNPAIETAPAKDLVVRAPNDWVAIARGTSTLKANDGSSATVKWMAVYTRAGQGWVVAGSQATRVNDIEH